MKIAVYPGSFDPITNGHIDIIKRASKIFDKVIVAVLNNPDKKAPLFQIEERLDLIKKVLTQYKNVEVASFSGLLIDFMKENRATIILKGLRNSTDFEYELQMSLMNKMLYPEIETISLFANSETSFISSSAVKQVAYFGGNLEGLVPDLLVEKIKTHIKRP